MLSPLRPYRWIDTRKAKRLLCIGLYGSGIALLVFLILTALQEKIDFFYTPTDLAQAPMPPSRAIQIGGVVAAGSFQQQEDGITARFIVTDQRYDVVVHYTGLMPDLFREGQGIVAKGQLGKDGVFYATTLLAKHDENYMPREVMNALKDSGKWNAPPPPSGRSFTDSISSSAATEQEDSGA